jgi:hypothetical protein
MVDASEGTLTRANVDAAAAATIMAAREPTTASTADYSGALQPCAGTCKTGVRVLTPEAQFCCYGGQQRSDDYGDDSYGYYDARAQRAGDTAAPATGAAAAEAHVASYRRARAPADCALGFTCWI